jgi:protein SCO1
MNRTFLHILYGVLAVIIISVFAFTVFQPIQVLPRMQLSPAFNLTDQNNQALTSEDLRGGFTLYTIIYTNCPSPATTSMRPCRRFRRVWMKFPLGGIKVNFVTISIDPDRDTPEVLNAYGTALGADFDQWKFATTSNKALLKTIIGSGFETYYEDKGEGNFALDPGFVLVDGWGIIRSEYRYVTEVSDADRILRHLGVLAAEVQNSTGSAKLAYEAAHLFLCYAP